MDIQDDYTMVIVMSALKQMYIVYFIPTFHNTQQRCSCILWFHTNTTVFTLIYFTPRFLLS